MVFEPNPAKLVANVTINNKSTVHFKNTSILLTYYRDSSATGNLKLTVVNTYAPDGSELMLAPSLWSLEVVLLEGPVALVRLTFNGAQLNEGFRHHQKHHHKHHRHDVREDVDSRRKLTSAFVEESRIQLYVTDESDSKITKERPVTIAGLNLDLSYAVESPAAASPGQLASDYQECAS